jgi:hypothetical protein
MTVKPRSFNDTLTAETLQPKMGIKAQSQKSIFDGQPKKPTEQQFQQQVAQMEAANSLLKQQAIEMAEKFRNLIKDKTLDKNKNSFMRDYEKEVIGQMISWSEAANSDETEPEGAGNLGLISLLIRTCFYQRDRINELEYTISKIDQKIQATVENVLATYKDHIVK